jgi:hypothetical protein
MSARIVSFPSGTKPYEELATFTHGGGGYAWEEMHVYRRDGRLFAARQNGCSCNTYETPDEADLVEISTLAAAEREYAKAFDYYGPAAPWLGVVERFREWGLR